MGGLFTTYNAHLVALRDGVAEVWEDASDERLVTGTPEAFVSNVLTSITGVEASSTPPRRDIGDPLEEGDESRLLEYLAAAYGINLLIEWGAYQQSYLKALLAVSRSALAEGWDKGRYIQEVQAVAERFGSKGFPKAAKAVGTVAAAWFFTKVVAQAAGDVVQSIFKNPVALKLYPLRVHVTARDERVRQNHRFDGFMARSDWAGWPLYLPPLGWGCRCRNYLVSWFAARKLGVNPNLVFPRGNAILVGKGPDVGFVRPPAPLPGATLPAGLQIFTR